mmetsp:Transcript_56249/g.147905  ORF Transcript_56249/g.147905 Transcript_56249/m.147905 type:complete len:347 (+) Transcript_56249:56-1096(+)
MAQAEAYYAQAHGDFLEMGLGSCASEVLQEGLVAYPKSRQLLELAGLPVPDDVEDSAPSITGDLLPSISAAKAAVATQAAVAPQFVPRPLPENLLPRDISGEQFWLEVRSRGFHALLLERGGIIRVTDLLPEELAEGALQALQQVDSKDWTLSSTATVAYGSDSDAIDHEYNSHRLDADRGNALDVAKQKLGTMLPEHWAGFQAARYERNGLIAPHDDSQMFHVPAGEETQRYPAGKLMYRKIAVICYLTKDWRKEYGGNFMDLHGEAAAQGSRDVVVPSFNSCVAFLVPRVHEVQRLAEGCPPRFSMFGWFSDDQPYAPLSQWGPELSCMEMLRGEVEYQHRKAK